MKCRFVIRLNCLVAWELLDLVNGFGGGRPLSCQRVSGVQIYAQQSPPTEEWQKVKGESTFWYSVSKRMDDSKPKIPFDRMLDVDGPLPPGAYVTFGDQRNEPKRTCLTSVAVDLTKNGLDVVSRDAYALDPSNIVWDMQRYIDCGLTTFQLKTNSRAVQEWGEEHVYGRIRQEMPSSILRDCHYVLSMETPSIDDGFSIGSVRETLLSSLHRMKCDEADSVQLKYSKSSPYHLDVLDTLYDLQTEGLVRSIVGRNMPSNMIRSAADCGFQLDGNQIDFNILDPTAYNKELQKTCSDLGLKLQLASPLAGGLLAERHLHQIREPPMELSPSEEHCYQKTLPKWAKQHPGGGGDSWQRYQRLVMGTLEEIAFKHQVGVESVSLRWALQLEHTASVVPACTLGKQFDNVSTKPQALRDVFRFELDDDDMSRLWKVSGRVDEELEHNNVLDNNNDVVGQGLVEDEFEIDMSDRSLWL